MGNEKKQTGLLPHCDVYLDLQPKMGLDAETDMMDVFEFLWQPTSPEIVEHVKNCDQCRAAEEQAQLMVDLMAGFTGQMVKKGSPAPIVVQHHEGWLSLNPNLFDDWSRIDYDEIDSLLRTWLHRFNRVSRGIRSDTMRMWIAILKAFELSSPPMTVRQMFYALVSHFGLAKTESAYNRVGYHLLKMRRLAIIPYSFIADSTRWMRKPTTFAGIDAFLEITQKTYRRMLWIDQPAYVEVWCEKDALAGVLYEITNNWDVPLMVTRGFPSESFLFEAAEVIKQQSAGKDAFVYFFGDHDPSGASIIESTERKLKDFGAEFEFKTVAVTPEQIDHYELPTRPTKVTDSRSKKWRGGSVELDALPVDVLRSMCESVIEQHIDNRKLEQTRIAEESERETFGLLRASLK